jgi:hypothetical protein
VCELGDVTQLLRLRERDSRHHWPGQSPAARLHMQPSGSEDSELTSAKDDLGNDTEVSAGFSSSRLRVRPAQSTVGQR